LAEAVAEYRIKAKTGAENMSEKKKEVPIWEKVTITIDEANAYSGIGVVKLRELTEQEDCPFVLWIGSRRLVKRKKFEEYLESQYSV